MTALALVSTNDQDVSVNTAAAQQTMADQLDSLSVVTSYAHAIGNTIINPVTSPPEDWYAPLNANLQEAKSHALVWIRDIAPKIGSEVPQTIINYNNTFKAATDEMLRILGNKQTLTNDEKLAIIDLIEATLDTLNDQKSKIDSVQKQIVTLSDQFASDHTKLTQGRDSAAKAVQSAEEERARIENKIAELQTELADARQKVTVSGIGLGLGIFLAVAAFALAVATGGAGLIVAGAVGVVGVGTAATFTGIFSAKINRLLDEIVQEQGKLENKKKQITALKGLLSTMESLKSNNENAKVALTHISTMWNTLNEKLESVITDLKNADGEAVKAAVRRMNINAARTSWNDTADWAKQIQNLASGTKVQPVIQHDTLVSAF
jgi:DNA repair exonuclease SbcCD ATPase subunit